MNLLFVFVKVVKDLYIAFRWLHERDPFLLPKWDYFLYWNQIGIHHPKNRKYSYIIHLFLVPILWMVFSVNFSLTTATLTRHKQSECWWILPGLYRILHFILVRNNAHLPILPFSSLKFSNHSSVITNNYKFII